MAGEGDCIRHDALESDFNFNLTLASEKFDLMTDVFDRQKTKRWVNRLKLEPPEGHTDQTRRTRNVYLKLILISLQNGVLDPRLDMEPPPRHNPLCVLEFPDCNFMPDWLQLFEANTESNVIMEAGGEGQCYLAGKTFENGGACGYIAVTTGKDDWLKPPPEKEDLSFIIQRKSKKQRSGNEDSESSSGNMVYPSCDAPTGSVSSDEQQETANRSTASPCKDAPPCDTQVPARLIPQGCEFETAIYYDVNKYVFERLKEVLPEIVIEEFKDGIYQKKKEIRNEELKKLRENAKKAIVEAKAIVKSSLQGIHRYKLALDDLTEMERKLRLCDRLHEARVSELHRRAVKQGFAGIVNCGCVESLMAENEELEEENKRVSCNISRLDQEWESVRVRLSLKDLREAMDFATERVKNIICEPQRKRTTC